MSQDNNFHQYGYDHYLKAPAKPRASASRSAGRGAASLSFLPLLKKLQSPVVAGAALLVTGAVFAGIIYLTYPSADENKRQIPIIKADLRPIKTPPVERGGMSIPNRDSTILSDVGRPHLAQSRAVNEDKRIENLLSLSNNDLINKEQAIQRAMDEDKVPSALAAQIRAENIKSGNLESISKAGGANNIDAEEDQVVIIEVSPSGTINSDNNIAKTEAKDILQKIGDIENALNEDTSRFSRKVASAAVKVKPKYNRKSFVAASNNAPVAPSGSGSRGHEAQDSDTIDFVRSVLNNDGANLSSSSSSISPAKIEPAAGGAMNSGSAITAGTYFVQLASITDSTRAAKEWSKMQVRYPMLSSVKYRVQEASLSNGTFYRIQAGPMSKSSANKICDALKASGKPGGCLVVK